MKQMKLLIMIPVWGRPEITSLTIRSLECSPPPFDYRAVFVVSKEDPHYETLCRLIPLHQRFETPNFPLGRKRNQGLTYALGFDWDYMVEMGSDNVWTPKLWEFLMPSFDKTRPMFGIKNLHYYNSLTDKAVFVAGYHIGWEDRVTAIGPGRCIRRDIVERSVFLWDENAQFGMDGHSANRVTKRTGVRADVIDNGKEPVLLNIFSPTCLTPWDDLDDRSEEADPAWVRTAFGIDDVQLKELRCFDKFHQAVLHRSNETHSRRRAFEQVNEVHRQQTGEYKYGSYDSYKTLVTRRYGSKNDSR